MRESEQQVERIKKNMQRIEKTVIEKKYNTKVTKAKAMFNTIINQNLINELRSRK